MAGGLAVPRALIGLVLATAGVATAQVIPLGNEFQANGYTTGPQRAPAVALDGAGNIVSVWQSFAQDGSSSGIFGRIEVGGQFVGPEFQVNVQTLNDQTSPVVGAASNGDFVVLWSSSYQDGFGESVVGRRYVAGGAFGSEFAVNVFTFGDQTNPAIAMSPGGEFVAAWDSDGEDGGGRGVFARRYDASGVPRGGEFQVNVTTTGDQARPAVAVGDTGFVIVWTSYGQDGEYGGIFGRRFVADGIALGGEFQVNTYTTDNQFAPSVAADAAGGFIVVWTSARGDGDYDGVAGRRYDDTGAALGGEFQVNAYSTGAQYQPRVAADATGDFVVVWQTPQNDVATVVGRRFGPDGTPLGGDFQVTTYTTIPQYDARVARRPEGDFVVTWSAYAGGTRASDVLVRRFTVPTTTLPPCAVSGTACDDGDPCTGDDVCNAGACAGQPFCTTSLPDDGAELPAADPVPVELEAAKGSECEAGLFGVVESPVVARDDALDGPALSKRKARRVGKRGRLVLKLKLNKAGRQALNATPDKRLPVVLRVRVSSGGREALLARLLVLRR